jgi:CBS domain-containing protein
MPTGIRAKDAMVAGVVTATPDQTVLEASKIMKTQDVGSVIIMENGMPAGIVTREDIVNKVTSEDKPASSIKLAEIMSKNLVTCSPECDLSELAIMMSKNGYERIPIVSGGKLLGIISAREIAKVAPAVIEIMTEHINIEEPQNAIIEEQGGECELCNNFSDNLHKVNDKWVCDTCKEEAEL